MKKKYLIVAIAAVLLSVISFIFIQKGNVGDQVRAERDVPSKSQRESGRNNQGLTGYRNQIGAGFAKKPDTINPQGLTPQKAKRLMAEASRITDLTKRSKTCSAIIEDLCKSGYPEEAWDLIEYGLGEVRKWQVRAFFRAAQVSDEALYQKFKELNDVKEVDFGMYGMVDRHINGDWVAFLKSDGFNAFLKSMGELGLPININRSLSPSLQSYISDFGEKDAVVQRSKLDQIVDAYQNKFIDSNTLGEVLKSANILSPEQKMEAMIALKDLGPVNGNLQVYRRRIIADLVREDPQEAISKFLKVTPSQQSSRDISTAIRSWISADSQAASDWYSRNSSTLTPFQKDSAAGVYYLIAMEDRSYETARTWIEEMENPARKREAQKMLEATLLKKQKQEAAAARPKS